MSGNILKNSLVVLITIFFIGASILPSISSINIKINNKMDNLKINECIKINLLKNYESQPITPSWLIGSDQRQISDCGMGFSTYSSCWHAQDFRPTKDILTAVALNMYWWGETPHPLEVTVAIRQFIDGDNLTQTTVIPDINLFWGKWVLFDFDDINVTPGKIYYIICTSNGNPQDHPPQWCFEINNPYTIGNAWRSNNHGITWYDLEDHEPKYPKVDFCFITYWKKPNNKDIYVSFLKIFEHFPNLFLFLQKLLNRLEQ